MWWAEIHTHYIRKQLFDFFFSSTSDVVVLRAPQIGRGGDQRTERLARLGVGRYSSGPWKALWSEF